MKKIYLGLAIFSLIAFSSPALVHGQQAPGFPYWGTNPPLLPCTGTDCTSICQILVLFQRLIYFGISLVFFAIAPVLFLWGGIMLLVSAGSPEKISRGKKILTGTLFGIGIALGSFIIVNTFFWAMGGLFGSQLTNWSNIVCG
ncbi:MAG: hypothetical protein HYT13_00750 [Candidatus Liptonbacteria bacterium]|nr:hypothetical protein [Candidatus Liptonbacteria bacterium]